MVTKSKFAGDLAAFGGEAHLTAGLDTHQAIFLQAAQRHGHGRRRDFQQVREASGDDGFAFGLGFEDGLEIVLFGDGDHWGDYTAEGLIIVNTSVTRTLLFVFLCSDFF